VDGLSGATLTSRGVSHMLELWLGPNGFKPYLDKFRQQQG
jgi:Na+-transporting NADH:ubiquinone oxidoreductase subunit C